MQQLTPSPKAASSTLRLTTLVAMLASVPCLARADITASFFPSADNTLYESATGSLSNGGGTAMFVGRTGQPTGSVRRGLLRFDPASMIPAGSTITGVSLTLVNSVGGAEPLLIGVHDANESWGEGASVATGGQGAGAPAAPGDATWTFRFFATTAWSGAGGICTSSPSAQTAVLGTGSYTWSGPGLVHDVQSWIDDPASNLGWLLRCDEAAPGTARRFSTREEADSALRPLLTVTYIPAPATSVLFPAALFAFARRRRSLA